MTFIDDEHWIALAKVHLSRYRLPRRDEPYAEDTFLLWCARLDLTPRNFSEIMGCSPTEFDNLNRWPLRAMVGLMLEARAAM